MLIQVLMLATFTANLAAFLTVERMQTTIQNLEELARRVCFNTNANMKIQKIDNRFHKPMILIRQSKINYTVLKDSPYMEYFKVDQNDCDHDLVYELLIGFRRGMQKEFHN